jgi:hypothetical protein
MQEATPELLDVQHRHVANLFSLIVSGDAAAAGPLGGKGVNLGVYVMRADSASAARTLAQDPAVSAGLLTIELHPWTAAWGTFPGDTTGAP